MSYDEGRLSGRQPQAIRSALAVLRTVAQGGPGISAKQVSESLRMPPATAYRLLNLLVAEEYLVRLPDLHGFALGVKFAELVGAVTPAQLSPAVALEALRQRTGQAVSLARYDAGGLDFSLPDPSLPADAELVEANLHASAVGKLRLSAAPDWRALMPTLPALTAHTITDPVRLDEELGGVRLHGYAVQHEELRTGSCCMAVPVTSSDGRLIAGLAVTGGRDLLREGTPRIYRMLRNAAEEIRPSLSVT